MNIEIRKGDKWDKYYLAHSFRDNGKVRKIRIYLGKNLTKIEKEKRREKAEKEIEERIKLYKVIRDPLRTVLSPKELEQIKGLEVRTKFDIIHLNEDDWKNFIESFTYDTNAIEGSTINSREVKEILEEDQWPKNREKWEISETYGVSEAIKFIRKTEDHMSLDLMKTLHKIVFRNSKEFAGKFRPKGVEVAVISKSSGIIHKGAPSSLVRKLLKELVEWYYENKEKYPPLLLAAVVHNQFENIHPFQDGNERVGRLLMNNILLKHNLPPVNIELKNRREYYNTLKEYEKDGNIRPTVELILKEYKSLKKLIKDG